MYLIILIDGYIFATSTDLMRKHLERKYADELSSVLYWENVDKALEHCNEVVE